MLAGFKCHPNVHSMLNKHSVIIFIHYKGGFFIIIWILEPDSDNITADYICWFNKKNKADFGSEIVKGFLAVLICNAQKASSNFLDIVDVELKIHYIA